MSSRTDSHTISVAENLFQGDAYTPGAEGGGRGLPIIGVVRADLGAPIVADVNGLFAEDSGDVTMPFTFTLDGALVTDGVAILDFPRNIVIDNDSASTSVITVTGTDKYGAPLVENITTNGTTLVKGKKAFKTVTSVTTATDTTGVLTVGSGDILGLPFALDTVGDLFLANEAGIVATIGTVVAAVTTNPATAITGDVRGTYVATDTLDGAATIVVYYFPKGRKTITGYGVPQFGG